MNHQDCDMSSRVHPTVPTSVGTQPSAPSRDAASIEAFEAIDARLRAWALGIGSEERRFPMLIASEALLKAGYQEGFPHLLMAPTVARDPETPLSTTNVEVLPWFLSPAVCYHAFAELSGRVLDAGVVFTARGSCFRKEESTALLPGRRQVEFEMREVILAGPQEWIEKRLERFQPAVTQIAADRGLEGTWCPATDPFFLPRARGRAHMQRLLGAKIELCLPCGLAIASINRHGTHLTERFDIQLTEGTHAHSACVAFGLDRWAAHSP
jgi:hypothetical protein